jgi:hypothetical protein
MRDARRLQRILDARANLWRWRLAGWLELRDAVEAEIAARRAAVGPSSAPALSVWADGAEARADRLQAALAARDRASRGVAASLSPLRQATAATRSAERLVRRLAIEQTARAAASEALDREAWDAARRVIEP